MKTQKLLLYLKLKMSVYFFIFFLCLNNLNLFAQIKKTESNVKQRTYLKLNDYKRLTYRQVCDAFLYANNKEYKISDSIITVIKNNKRRYIKEKIDNKNYAVYNSYYYLSQGLISLHYEKNIKKGNLLVEKSERYFNLIKDWERKKKMKVTGFTSALKKLPEPDPKVALYLDKIRDELKEVKDKIVTVTDREKLLSNENGVRVSNCDDDISALDMKISLDYIEEGIQVTNDLAPLQISNKKLNATLEVLAQTINQYVNKNQAPPDGVYARIIGKTNDSPFKTNLIINGKPFKGLVYEQKEVIILPLGKSDDKYRFSSSHRTPVTTHEQLAKLRVEIPKQKLLQLANVLEESEIETTFLINQQDNQITFELIIKDAFKIYLDDIARQTEQKLFSEKLDMSCICATQCANDCEQKDYCSECPQCENESILADENK